MRRVLAILIVLACFLPAAAYDKKPKVGSLIYKENQVDEIPTLPKTAPSTKDCVNYQWAAAVESILRAEQISLKYEDLVARSSGGLKCYPQWDYAETTRFVTGDYFVANKKMHVEATWQAGVPMSHDILANLQRNVPVLFVWKGKPYLVYGALYDYSYRAPGFNDFQIKELRLMDLAVPAKSADRTLIFSTERDDKSQIDGVLWLKVTTPE
jgi:hypothetical protein